MIFFFPYDANTLINLYLVRKIVRDPVTGNLTVTYNDATTVVIPDAQSVLFNFVKNNLTQTGYP